MAIKCCNITWDIVKRTGKHIFNLYCPICAEELFKKIEVNELPGPKILGGDDYVIAKSNVEAKELYSKPFDIYSIEVSCPMCGFQESMEIVTDLNYVLMNQIGMQFNIDELFDKTCLRCKSPLDLGLKKYEKFEFRKRVIGG